MTAQRVAPTARRKPAAPAPPRRGGRGRDGGYYDFDRQPTSPAGFGIRHIFTLTDKRTRFMVVLTVCSLVVSLVLSWVLGRVGQHIAESNIPVLEDAIVAPYDLPARPFAPLDMTQLPQTISEYTLIQTISDGEIHNAIIGGYAGPEYAVAGCIVTVSTPSARPCMLTPRAEYLTAGYYQHTNGAAVSVVAARYMLEGDTSVAMRELLNTARALGATGNFLIDVGEVDFFYSRVGAVYSYTYAHGPWLFVVNGWSDADVQAFTEVFPY